jgi:hypothetical protein
VAVGRKVLLAKRGRGDFCGVEKNIVAETFAVTKKMCIFAFSLQHTLSVGNLS